MGLLDAIGQGLAYGSDEQKQNRADEREFSNYEKKLKLAQDMQLKLEERKMQLSQKFPKLMQVQGNYGVITGIMSDGSTRELARDEEARAAELDRVAAQADSARSLADYRIGQEQGLGEKRDLDAARAEEARAKAEAAAAKAAGAGDTKPMTEAQQRANIAKATALVMKEAQDNYEDDLSEEEIQTRVAAKLAQQDALLNKTATAVGAGIAPVAGVAESSDNPFAKYQKQ